MIDSGNDIHEGGCLCGGVRYRVTGWLDEVIGCHCGQCQKTSGHHVAATRCNDADLELLNDETLTWYRSSETARRGFCGRCGGNLFWKRDDRTTTSIMAGTLDQPTRLKLTHHIFVADKSDYYDIEDGTPQKEAY